MAVWSLVGAEGVRRCEGVDAVAVAVVVVPELVERWGKEVRFAFCSARAMALTFFLPTWTTVSIGCLRSNDGDK